MESSASHIFKWKSKVQNHVHKLIYKHKCVDIYMYIGMSYTFTYSKSLPNIMDRFCNFKQKVYQFHRYINWYKQELVSCSISSTLQWNDITWGPMCIFFGNSFILEIVLMRQGLKWTEFVLQFKVLFILSQH